MLLLLLPFEIFKVIFHLGILVLIHQFDILEVIFWGCLPFWIFRLRLGASLCRNNGRSVFKTKTLEPYCTFVLVWGSVPTVPFGNNAAYWIWLSLDEQRLKCIGILQGLGLVQALATKRCTVPWFLKPDIFAGALRMTSQRCHSQSPSKYFRPSYWLKSNDRRGREKDSQCSKWSCKHLDQNQLCVGLWQNCQNPTQPSQV